MLKQRRKNRKTSTVTYHDPALRPVLQCRLTERIASYFKESSDQSFPRIHRQNSGTLHSGLPPGTGSGAPARNGRPCPRSRAPLRLFRIPHVYAIYQTRTWSYSAGGAEEQSVIIPDPEIPKYRKAETMATGKLPVLHRRTTYRNGQSFPKPSRRRFS